MTAKISNYKDILYNRDYLHDVPRPTDLAKRVGLAALPFLSMVPPLRYPLSIAMGTLRVWNTEDAFHKIFALGALVGAVWKPRVGTMLTTTQNIILEIQKMRTQDNWADASKSLFKITSDCLYLALIARGGLELAIIASLMQGAVRLIQSRDEFKKGLWIEATADLLMAALRLKDAHGQYAQLKRNRAIDAAMRKIYVGMLHEKWQFPSDHLPVGVDVNGTKIISWNVLNNAYMEWVTDKDSQGLNGSMISDLNKPIDASGLTYRDVFVADCIQEMMAKGHIIALQECGQPFLKHLAERLSPDWGLVRSFQEKCKDQDVILYNKQHCTYRPEYSVATRTAYPSDPGRPLQNAYFALPSGQDVRIINAHIPGNPLAPGRDEFAAYVHEQHKAGATTIALGDNNFERDEMIKAYQGAGFEEFSIHSPWKTNIDPVTKESKGIDHIFIAGNASSRDLSVDEVLPGHNLQETIDLLNEKALSLG